MKKRILSTVIMMALAITTSSHAQVGIGVETANINASAQLEVASTTKGFLPPRMTNAQKVEISSPAAGLVLWCTNCGAKGELQVYNGTEWVNMVGAPASAAVIPLAIGSDYQGGKIAYIYQSGDSGYIPDETHGLIVATEDQGPAIVFSHPSNFTSTGTDIGTGNDNTNTLHDQGNRDAVQAVWLYNGGGNSDWYLPSRGELNLLYQNKALIGGGFGDYVYWTSTVFNEGEYGIYVAYQNLGNGDIGSTNLDYNNEFHVRAIRSF